MIAVGGMTTLDDDVMFIVQVGGVAVPGRSPLRPHLPGHGLEDILDRLLQTELSGNVPFCRGRGQGRGHTLLVNFA